MVSVESGRFGGVRFEAVRVGLGKLLACLNLLLHWQWYRSYGNKLWEFDDEGLMRRRLASINDAPITEKERRVLMPAS